MSTNPFVPPTTPWPSALVPIAGNCNVEDLREGGVLGVELVDGRFVGHEDAGTPSETLFIAQRAEKLVNRLRLMWDQMQAIDVSRRCTIAYDPRTYLEAAGYRQVWRAQPVNGNDSGEIVDYEEFVSWSLDSLGLAYVRFSWSTTLDDDWGLHAHLEWCVSGHTITRQEIATAWGVHLDDVWLVPSTRDWYKGDDVSNGYEEGLLDRYDGRI